MKRIIKKVQGITLIALVVTIVVLLILAAVTINMAVNQNGLFARAKNATSMYKEAEADESEGLDSLETTMEAETGSIQPIDTTTLAEVNNQKGIIIKDSKKKYTDSDGKVAIIPRGFCVVTDAGKIANGLVISDVAGDDSNNTKGGNQYVWIPVASISDYARKDFGNQYGNYNQYSEEMPIEEKASVTKYKGYYIGRYEA